MFFFYNQSTTFRAPWLIHLYLRVNCALDSLYSHIKLSSLEIKAGVFKRPAFHLKMPTQHEVSQHKAGHLTLRAMSTLGQRIHIDVELRHFLTQVLSTTKAIVCFQGNDFPRFCDNMEQIQDIIIDFWD